MTIFWGIDEAGSGSNPANRRVSAQTPRQDSAIAQKTFLDAFEKIKNDKDPIVLSEKDKVRILLELGEGLQELASKTDQTVVGQYFNPANFIVLRIAEAIVAELETKSLPEPTTLSGEKSDLIKNHGYTKQPKTINGITYQAADLSSGARLVHHLQSYLSELGFNCTIHRPSPNGAPGVPAPTYRREPNTGTPDFYITRGNSYIADVAFEEIMKAVKNKVFLPAATPPPLGIKP